MSKFEKKVEELEEVVFDDEDYLKGKKLIKKIIDNFPEVSDVDAIQSFLSNATLAISIPEDIDEYDLVTQWLMANYSRSENTEFAEEILSWLNNKIEFNGQIDCLVEMRLSLKLFEYILNSNEPDKPHESLTNDFQGYSTYALEVGIIDQDKKLIENAISAQRKVLELYKTGTFPDYYNLSNFIAGAKLGIGSAILEAYKFDNNTFLASLGEAERMLQESVNEYQEHGSQFNKEYSQKLLAEYNALKP